MDEFKTIARLWPTGVQLPGVDENQVGGPANFTRTADKFSSDGVKTYEFLFWNTGRHLTAKRKVKWSFSVLGWNTWTATRWYGIPGGGGANIVRADAFSIGGDNPLNGTPIDKNASTFSGAVYPLNGDDHQVGTANGGATLAAKDPFHAADFHDYDFAGWMQMIFGGDDNGEFDESDAGSGGTIGGAGFYDHVAGKSFTVAQHQSALLLAAYGHCTDTKSVVLGNLRDKGAILNPHFNPVSDPSPEDPTRLKNLGLGSIMSQKEKG